MAPSKVKQTAEIQVYIDTGTVYSYTVHKTSVREHTSAIVKDGYRSVSEGVLTHWPPHRILKVKATGADTMYADTQRGT